MNLKEQALSVLRIGSADKPRLSEAAFDCFAKHDAIEVAADIVLGYPGMVAPANMEGAVRALIALARLPRAQLAIDEPISNPEPLKKSIIFGRS